MVGELFLLLKMCDPEKFAYCSCQKVRDQTGVLPTMPTMRQINIHVGLITENNNIWAINEN